MTVQVWILLKHHKMQHKSPKRARDVEKSQEAESKLIFTQEKPVTKFSLLKGSRIQETLNQAH